jgi:hypothetical protein
MSEQPRNPNHQAPPPALAPEADNALTFQIDPSLGAEQSGATMEIVTARTLATRFEEFERIERLMAEARGDNALHEVERHHFSLAPLPRQAAEDVIDAEFRVIDAKPREDGPE